MPGIPVVHVYQHTQAVAYLQGGILSCCALWRIQDTKSQEFIKVIDQLYTVLAAQDPLKHLCELTEKW